MKKRFSALILTFMSLFLTCFLTGLPAEAAEQAEASGVEVLISSDKEDYAGAEDAQISFTIRNTNETDLDGVNWALQLPDGLSAKSGSLSGENLRIRAGESYEGSASVELATPDTTEAVTDTSESASADGTTTAPAVKAGETASAFGLFGVIAAAAALLWITRKKSKKLFGIFSVFFCAGLIAVSAPSRTFAADEEGISIDAEKTVKIDGTSYTIKLSVTADAMQEAANPGDFYAWAEYSKDNNAITVKWQAQEDASGYQVFDKADPETPLAEVKDKTEYVCPLDETAKEKYVFLVKAEKADGKQSVSNDVTLRRNSDGSYTFSDIDSDRDGLDDLDEISRKTDRLNPDTDGDGLKDGYEVNQGSTDPLAADTDENGTQDGEEDFDGDGIPTQKEGQRRTNPYAADTDGDGFSDGYETENGMDPVIADQIVIDDKKAAALKDYTLTDLEALNENEEYPLEIYYNDDKFIERINGIYTTEKILNAQDALYSLYHIKSLLGMEDPATELKFIKAVYSQWTTAYSFGLQYKGIEVEGCTVTVTCKKDGKINSLLSHYMTADHFKNLNTKPLITKQRLKAFVNSGSDKPVEIISSDLCIRMNPEAVLVYRVVTSEENALWIDAHTGKTVYENDMMSEWAVVTAKDELKNDRKITTLHDEADGTDYYYLRSDLLRTAVYLYGSYGDAEGIEDRYDSDKPDVIQYGKDPYSFPAYSQHAFRSDPTHRAVPEPGDWDGQAVSAFYNFLKVRERYASKGYYGLNGENGPSAIYVRANNRLHSPPHTTAAYKRMWCDEIYFSDQCDRFTSYTNNLDVIGHEFGHGVIQYRNGQSEVYGLTTPFTESLAEGYADIFGSWVQGSWLVTPRDIADPNRTHNPVKIGGRYYDENAWDPHLNSTVISHAAYLLNTKYDYSFDDLYDVFFESIPSIDNFCMYYSQVRDAIVAAARGIGYSYEKVLDIYNAFEEVGVARPTGSAKITVKEGAKYLEKVIVQVADYGTYRTLQTNQKGIALFSALQVGTHRVIIHADGHKALSTTILVNKGERTDCVIDLLSASTDYEWDRYDHYNFDQEIGPTLDHHIEMNDTDITMRGYTEVPFKDFLLTHENDVPDSFVHGDAKILSFNIDRDEADWHTLEGGGFLFDVTISDKPSETDIDSTDSDVPVMENAGTEGFLTAHCVLVTSDGLKLFYLKDIDIALFRDGKLGRICNIGVRIGKYSYDIGDVTAEHSISVSIRKGTSETISVIDNGKVIVENLEVDKLDGDDYGPITSHDDHWCEQESWFTFSDILMSNVY